MKQFNLINRNSAIRLMVLAILSVLLVLGACKSATPGTTTATTASTVTTTTTTVSTPSFTVNTVNKASFGNYLVDSKGMALYYFTKDTVGNSTAVGPTLAAWPLFSPSTFTVPSSLNAADFGTITRADGAKVATYKGWPLYYYAKDVNAGDTLGDGVGGVWYLIKVPFYTVMLETKTGIGNYLIDAKGMTLYYFGKDSVGQSAATTTILQTWPIFSAANFIVTSGTNASDFGTMTRSDGLKQSTYKGWPLYYYSGDKSSGDTNGQGINNLWYAVTPANFPPTTTPTTATTTTSTTTTTATPATTATTTPTTGGPPVTVSLVAQGVAFNTNTITVPAGASVTINFNNKDTVPHNFALYTNSSATSPALFQGQIVTGPATVTYTFAAPTTPGTYFFRCDIHPTIMTGSFVVTAAGAQAPTPTPTPTPPPGGGGGGGY